MIHTLDDSLGRAACAWVNGVQRRPVAVVAAIAAITAALIAYAANTLGLHTNENDLFSNELRFVELRADFYSSFPNLVDPIVVVVDGATTDLAYSAAERLANRLRHDPKRFSAVYQPFSGEFFERNGLLYLEPHELYDLLDNLFAVQPQLSALSRDMSLHGFLSMLSDAAAARISGELEGFDLTDVFLRVNEVIEGHLDGRPRSLSWADVITGRASTLRDRRRFLLLQPVVDYADFEPAETALLGLRDSVAELGFNGDSGVRVRATGVLPLAYEEMQNVGAQSLWAGVASFLLVGAILMTGLGSKRLVLASLVTLLVGLGWTAGFAALTVGRLNLISVAFAVLFIGLSIDFAIHLCVRLREALSLGDDMATALPRAARHVGGSLVLCASTTAIGFFAFAPTEYKGVAELGIIAGSGMFISLFTNLTLLPALIAWKVPAAAIKPIRPLSGFAAPLLAIPVERARSVALGAALLFLLSLTLLPEVHFEPNPLRMRDPSTESVQAMSEMLADGDAFPWNLNVLMPNLESAQALAARIEALPQVDHAVTLSSFVPTDQGEKLSALEDAAFVLLPTLHDAEKGSASPAKGRAAQLAALSLLEATLGNMPSGDFSRETTEAAKRLGASVHTLLERESGSGDEDGLASLEVALIGSLAERLRLLRASLTSPGVVQADIPRDVAELMLGTDGRARIEVFPAGDLGHRSELEAYVGAVQEIAPDTFGEGLVILETGRAVVRSLQQALFTAAALIGLLLLVVWRNVTDAALVAAPIVLAALFTAACTVLLEVPLNFANVIVIPLLLGMGVDSGIHLVHRARVGELPRGNLLSSSTARAVALSALTTIASFGTLGFSPHQGIASLGRLLAFGLAMILLCSLVVLPALVQLSKRPTNP